MKIPGKYGIVLVCLIYLLHPPGLFAQMVNVGGIITSCSGGQTITGAEVKFIAGSGGQVYQTLSTSGGDYSLDLPPGLYPTVIISKRGFDTLTNTSVNIPNILIYTLNFCLEELANPVPQMTCQFDSLSQSVHCNWLPPTGPYEILYDDGTQDSFTVWASGGNKNGLKFTPLAYPLVISGGKVNIGNSSSYPPQYSFADFQMAVYDDSGPGGLPGNQLASVNVTPPAFGWVDFQFSGPVTINSGNFYLVMIQSGNYPDATGLAIDMTNPQFRSFSKFGNQTWIPAQGNFMIRAAVSGPEGPAYMETGHPASAISYQLYRLHQGEEQNPAVWTSLTVTSNISYTDPSWPSLPCGPYRWGIKALYPDNRQSAPAFSNVIGKCWTAPVVINVTMSCPAHPIHGTKVKLLNQVYPDTCYYAVLDTSHSVVFPGVWKGSYTASILHFGFQTWSSSEYIMLPDTINVTLLQVKSPPSSLTVDGKTLKSSWKLPSFSDTLFSENWSSGSFATHGWTTTPLINNWEISTTNGNPAPSAYFSWIPQEVNYENILQSPLITNPQSGVTLMGYDIYLDNYSTTTQNKLAVEIWNGSTWNTIRLYSNQGGSIPWTSEQIDITAGLTSDFKIRFRAFGENTYDINGWNVDNIYVLGTETPQQMGQCIFGYYFLLGSVVSGFVADNQYTIPGMQVQYGTTYNACVDAVYGSGVSSQACTSFESRFLWPVNNFQGDTIQNAVYLHWEKPEMTLKGNVHSGTPPGLLGYSVYRDSVLIAFVNTDTLYYYDLNLAPGTYSYTITARYDLAPYGFPGMSDESYPRGPISLYISYGQLIPFLETWDEGTFTYNNWSLDPAGGNWVIDPANGQPPPSAVFNWNPPLINYADALESGDLDPATYHCAGIWVDFLLKLEDQNANSTESLAVEVYYNNNWHPELEIKNRGNFDWSFYHVDISEVRQKGFRVRFVAKGVSSTNILHWMVDNINVYGICYAPVNLTAEAEALDVHLSWNRPQCTNGGIILDEGFEGSQFPPPSWTQIINDQASTWKQGDTHTPQGVHSGQYAALLPWDYVHQDEWLIAHQVYVSGNLTFWSFAYQGSAHGDHYYVMVTTDQGANWTTLLDLSALPPFPQNNGFNAWLQPYVIDMSEYRGNIADIAWRAVDGDGYGLWYSWAIDDCSVGYTPVILSGYDIYRKLPDSLSYVKINTTTVKDTFYVDSSLRPGLYKYYTVALLGECTQGTPSDTAMVDVVTGTGPDREKGLKVFPNPARDQFRVVSDEPWSEAELYNQLGIKLFAVTRKESNGGYFSLRGLSPGVYYLKLQFEDHQETVLVTKSE
jgi:hypothetical protein